MEKASFAAGCFWDIEAMFRQLPGVVGTAAGYSGGITEYPTYEDVCTGTTGHAETVFVEYDPVVTSYEKLLDAFWACHDPTQVNQQESDVGTQYRSIIFYHTPEQQAAAEASKANLQHSGKVSRPIVTEIVPAGPFYRAESYHQQYLEKRGKTSGCSLGHGPK